MIPTISNVLLFAGMTIATPFGRRQVNELNQEAFEEAQQRDDTATRAFSDVQITTFDGKCLSVDILSGDFRANLTPVQVVECGSTDGEGWDIITSGAHNDRDGQMLVVSTLTQACLNFDPRRASGNQVNLFSCGGRADGGGEVTDSQLFAFDGGAGPLAFQPANGKGQCLSSAGDALDVAPCVDSDNVQSFTIGESDDSGNEEDVVETPIADPVATPTEEPTASITAPPTGPPSENPTEPIPVSGAGGFLDPEAAAEAHQLDETATRLLESINIRASDGRCLFIDPTAGDFRQNLIPVELRECNEEPNQKFDVISSGKHNSGRRGRGRVLLSSVLMNGCISFDGRRDEGDTVNIFSCGGRADGDGNTDNGQLFRFSEDDIPEDPSEPINITLEPRSRRRSFCFIAGDDRLESVRCAEDDAQVFELVKVL